jgi:hypothetical protein
MSSGSTLYRFCDLAAPSLRQRSQVKSPGSLSIRIWDPLPNSWASDIDLVIVPNGPGVNEVAFIHRSTSTLVLTDFIQNFEPEKVSPLVRSLVRFAPVPCPQTGSSGASSVRDQSKQRRGRTSCPNARGLGAGTRYLRSRRLVRAATFAGRVISSRSETFTRSGTLHDNMTHPE